MGLSDFNSLPLSEMTLIAVQAAMCGGEILKKGFGTSYSIQSKRNIHDLVTDYDRKSEKAIIDFLKKKYSNHTFLSEECGKIGEPSQQIEWIIDPLDGTVNFVHEIPVFSVSIAARKEGEVVVGAIYQPLTTELFLAEKGVGSFFKGKKLEVSEVKEIKKSFLVTGFPYNVTENPHHCIEHFIEFIRMGIPIRRMGSAALDYSYVAAGKFDGFFEASLAPWDCAAGKLMVELAKGKVSTWDGKILSIDSYASQVASNGWIHDQLVKILHDKNPRR